MGRFDSDTAVTLVGDGRFDVTLDPGWWVVNAPNGGYLAGICARAAEAAANPETPAGSTGYKRVRSITFHFLRAPVPGAAEVRVVLERIGRSITTATVRLEQSGVLQVLAVASIGSARPGPEWNELTAPIAPAPDSVTPRVVTDEQRELAAAMGVTIGDRYDIRPCLGSAAPEVFSETESRPAHSGGWLRFSEPNALDQIGLVAMADAWMPPIVHKLPGHPPVAPTVELTVHVRNLPTDDSGWVLASYRSPVSQDGYIVEDAELWDRSGTLLATARQLAVVP